MPILSSPPCLCDVNVLLALCYSEHAQNAPALEWLSTIEEDDSLGICRFSQLALLRLLNNPMVMQGQPHTASQTWADYDLLMSDDRFVFYSEPAGLEEALRALTNPRPLSPRHWPDAYLAAFAIAGGLRFVTFDAGLRQYPGLDLVLLK